MLRTNAIRSCRVSLSSSAMRSRSKEAFLAMSSLVPAGIRLSFSLARQIASSTSNQDWVLASGLQIFAISAV